MQDFGDCELRVELESVSVLPGDEPSWWRRQECLGAHLSAFGWVVQRLSAVLVGAIS